jgi:hypothetical protein
MPGNCSDFIGLGTNDQIPGPTQTPRLVDVLMQRRRPERFSLYFRSSTTQFYCNLSRWWFIELPRRRGQVAGRRLTTYPSARVLGYFVLNEL